MHLPQRPLSVAKRMVPGTVWQPALDSLRFFCLMEKIPQYKFIIKYLLGKRNFTADFLYCYLALRAPPDAKDTDQEADLAMDMTMAAMAALSQEDGITMVEDVVLDVASADPVYQFLVA